MEREKLILDKEDGRAIVYGDNSNFKTIQDNITDTSRWSEHHEIVVQRLSDKKYFKSEYFRGLTDYQEEHPFDNSEPIFYEVFPVEKTIIVYE